MFFVWSSSRSDMFLYFGIVLGILASISGSNGQITYPTEETCLTSARTQGTCINLNECSPLLVLLRQPRPLSPQVLDTLRKAQCGFDGTTPKVCCPSGQPTVPTTTATEETLPDVTQHRNLRLLDNVLCGPITQERIFGGNKTTVFEFPWMALIAYRQNNRSPEFRCGGSVISKRYVLTAAHCVTGLDAGLRVTGVRLGEHDLSKERDCDYDKKGMEITCTEGYQDFEIENFKAHSGYSRSKLQNDIALIRLTKDVDFRPMNVRPVCLPIGSTNTLMYQKATVTGWGTTENGQRSQALLQARLPIMPNDECTRVYKKHKVEIWYKQLCAGGVNRTDSCAGDSGGPLQAPSLVNNQPKTVQYGVVSFGPRNCGIEGIPGVYTRVAYYTDWILDTMTD